MWSALGGIADSIFGASDAKKDRQMAQQQFDAQMDWSKQQSDLQQANFIKNFDYQDMLNRNQMQIKAKDAKEAGFHPLYAMGGQTVSASLQTPSGTAGASPTAGSHRSNTNLAGVGQALDQRKVTKLNMDLLESQIKEVDSRTLKNLDFVAESRLNSQKRLLQEKMNNNHDADQINIGGIKVKPSKHWSNTQDIEDRYGDVISWLYGVGVLGGDAKQWLRDNMQHDPKKSLKYIKQKMKDAEDQGFRYKGRKWFGQKVYER